MSGLLVSGLGTRAFGRTDDKSQVRPAEGAGRRGDAERLLLLGL